MTHVTVNVHMTMFCDPGTIRQVKIHERDWYGNVTHKLNTVFQYGQNEFQPVSGMPSVSSGDVVELDGEYWLIKAIGFDKLTSDQFTAYVAKSLPERLSGVFQ